MLLKKVYHALDFVYENFNLRGQLFVVWDDFHHFSQKHFVVWEIIGINSDALFGVGIEILEIG